MSLNKLSKKSGVSSTTINDIENNIVMPQFITLILIAKGLNVELKELYIVYW